MKKRIISLVLVIVLALGLCVPAAAASTTENVAITYRAIKIQLNGKEITPCDAAGNTVEPFIMNSNGTTYLPLRAIGQALGLNVKWDGAANTVTLTSGGEVKTGAGAAGTTTGGKNVDITYRDIKVILDGKQLDLVNAKGEKVEPFILNSNSSVYLPLRVVGEALGLKVSWDGASNTAYLGEDTSGVTGITLNQSKIWFFPGDTYQLVATVEPADAVNKTVTWTSSDPSVATVSASGLVTMVKVGTATITATTSNGLTASCVVIVQERVPTNTVLYEDSKVKITYLKLEKSRYDSDDEITLYCDVQNKTNYPIMIQCEAISINGYCFNNNIMSDKVAANCTGTTDTTIRKFDFDKISLNNISTVGGLFRIISNSSPKQFNTYEANSINKDLYGSGSVKVYPEVSGQKLLFSDSRLNIYYHYAEQNDDSLDVYLTVQNKSSIPVMIQNDTVVVSGRSYDNTIMSDPVLAYTTGDVCVSVRNCSIANPTSITGIGGDFRIIDYFSDPKTFSTYTASLNANGTTPSTPTPDTPDIEREVTYYKGYEGAVDLGKLFGVPYAWEPLSDSSFVYYTRDIYEAGGRDAMNTYLGYLYAEGFRYGVDSNIDGVYKLILVNDSTGLTVSLTIQTLSSGEVVKVMMYY